jgi:phospholipid transport system substrate-binding protein
MKDLIVSPWKADPNANILGVTWVILGLAIVFHSPLPVAGVPTDQVWGTVDRVMTILQDPRSKSPDKRQERREQLSKVISARFDFAEMARRSLGAEWRRLKPPQQQEFVVENFRTN